MRQFRLFSIPFILCLLVGCMSDSSQEEYDDVQAAEEVKSDTAYLNHYNVIIALDVSNRIQRDLFIEDVELVRSMYRLFRTEVLSCDPRMEKTMRKDVFTVKVINGNELANVYDFEYTPMKVDLSRFGNVMTKRREFLVSTNGKSQFEHKVDSIATMLNGVYAKMKNAGVSACDLQRFLKEEIDEIETRMDSSCKSISGNPVVHTHLNKLVILTDGYIETSNHTCKDANKRLCYDLKQAHIENFRKNLLRDFPADTDPKSFFDSHNYGIVPVENPLLRNYDVLVVQCDDLSVNKYGTKKYQPTDFEIMEIFWKDWLEDKGGCKSVELVPKSNSIQKFEQRFRKFLGYRK